MPTFWKILGHSRKKKLFPQISTWLYRPVPLNV